MYIILLIIIGANMLPCYGAWNWIAAEKMLKSQTKKISKAGQKTNSAQMQKSAKQMQSDLNILYLSFGGSCSTQIGAEITTISISSNSVNPC